MTVDLKAGGEVAGRTIPAHSERIYLEAWQNGAMVEVLFYEEPPDPAEPSDRIHLVVTPADGESQGWLMNVEDAIGVIRGLSVAVQAAIEAEVPIKPGD